MTSPPPWAKRRCAKSANAKQLLYVHPGNVVLNFKNILKFMNFTEF